MKKIKLLDLYCGAGGCSWGYYLAARRLGYDIEIVGVDNRPQKNYPFHFRHGDALEYLSYVSIKGTVGSTFDFTHVHASPPCQLYTRSTAEHRKKGVIYSDILNDTVSMMKALSIPGVVENVMCAPILNDIVLTGTMFGLKTIRERKFELINWFMMKPGKMAIKKGSAVNGDLITCAGNGSLYSKNAQPYSKIDGGTIREKWSSAMGINWMSRRELAQAIPPAYTEYIGMEFLKR